MPAFSAFRAGLAVVFAISIWIAFAPQSVGGAFDYAFVNGNSMSPLLHTGDAVLIRRASDYGVGDIVASRNPDLGIVMHRIVADDGERFTLRGDNRTSADSYHPTRSDIIGKEWGIIPHAGYVLHALQRPRALVALLGGLALLLVAGSAVRRRRSGGAGPAAPRSTGGGRRTRRRLAETLTIHGATGQAIVGSLVVVLLVGGALAGLDAVRGDQTSVTHTLAFSEAGRFTYGSTVPGGVYDGNQLGAPQPVFLDLVRSLPVTFDYQLAPITPGAALADVAGATQLNVQIQHPNGWSKTIPVQGTVLFAGNAARAQGVIDLGEILNTITAAETQTGVKSLYYTIHIGATVHADGTFGGVPFSRDTDQGLDFRLTENQMQFDTKASALESNANITVGRPAIVPRTMPIPLLGVELPFSRLPDIALGSVVVAALGFLAVALGTRAVSRRGPVSQIRARYGHLLVALDDDDRGVPEATVGASSLTPTALPRNRRRAQPTRRRARRARMAPAATTLSPPTADRALPVAPPRATSPSPFVPTALPPSAAVAPPRAPQPVATPPPAQGEGGLILPASLVPPRPLDAPSAITVESFDDLARVAEQRGLPVLWSSRDGVNEYWVRADDITYRFAITATAPQERSEGAEAPRVSRIDPRSWTRRAS